MSANSDPREFHQKINNKIKIGMYYIRGKGRNRALAAFLRVELLQNPEQKKTAWLLFTIIVMYNLEIWRPCSVRFIHV